MWSVSSLVLSSMLQLTPWSYRVRNWEQDGKEKRWHVNEALDANAFTFSKWVPLGIKGTKILLDNKGKYLNHDETGPTAMFGASMATSERFFRCRECTSVQLTIRNLGYYLDAFACMLVNIPWPTYCAFLMWNNPMRSCIYLVKAFQCTYWVGI